MIKYLIMIAAAVVFALMAVVFISIWVYKDARQRGLSAGMWVLIVVLSGTFIGLFLYLLVGRKQRNGVCDKCGEAINIQGAFCPTCGETIAESKRILTKNKGLLYISITFILLVFAQIGIGIYTYTTVGGFAPLYRYEINSSNISGSVKNVTINSFDDTWEFSYDGASGGYTLSNLYNATTKPAALSVEIRGAGSVQLIVEQGDVSISETLVAGTYCYEMTAFETGALSVKLINIDASNLSGKMVFETEN